MFKKFGTIILFTVLVVIVLLAWYFRPFFHDLLMSFYRRPLNLIFLILSIGILLDIIVRRKKYFRNKKYSKWNKVIIIAAALLIISMPASFLILIPLILYFIFGGLKHKLAVLALALVWIANIFFITDLEYLVAAKNLSYEKRNEFPVVEPVRILPKLVATRYAEDALQSSQEYLGDSQIVLAEGELKRVFPRLPDGGLLYFINKLEGFITIDVSSLSRKAEIEDQRFEVSEGIGVLDNIYFKLKKKKYFVDYQEPIYLKDGNEWVAVVPYIDYKSLPVRMPYWGGFMVVRPDGTITDHKPEDAQKIAFTKGNRVHPATLSYYYAESYAYRLGLLNKWFIHKDQPVIDSTEDSPPPFHIATTEGFKQVIFTRPRGGSYGISKIFIFDATSGKKEIIEFDNTTLLTGPVAAAEYVKKAFPTIDYSMFSIIEPRPLMVGGKLYWMFSLANQSGAGVSKTIFVDASSNSVIDFETEEDISNFITKGVEVN